jgi:multiple sugar transport system ATP-binding protein
LQVRLRPTLEPMAKVIIENLHKIYPGDKGRQVTAVENLNLRIDDEEFMVFVGPSGCGKSTTLRMIAGLEDISQGNIYIDDKRLNDVPPKDRDIAMVFQNYALYPHMTVYKNMAFGLELRKLPREEINQRVSEAAQILGLTDEMLQRKPKALSGGQRQRVALGRSIVRKPKVFLFDEPLSNLDAKMRVQMRGEIAKLHGRLRNTMIYVTHDQVEAMTLGDRICVMKSGRVQQVAQPLEIYNRPANMFVAGFIGSPAMNFIAGKIIERAGSLFFSEESTSPGAELLLLQVDENHGKHLAKWLDKPLVMGLRPEDMEARISAGSANPRHLFNATVEIIEAMGAETYLYLHSGAHPLIARSRSQMQVAPKEQIEMVAHMEKAHFFEAVDCAPFKKESGEIDLDEWHASCKVIV